MNIYYSEKQVIQREGSLLSGVRGPKARRVFSRTTALEPAPSPTQMLQSPKAFKFIHIMEKILLEQG